MSSERVSHNSNGVRVVPGSASSLALGLICVLGDADLRARFGEAGRAMAVAEYAAEARRDKWIAVMRDLFGSL